MSKIKALDLIHLNVIFHVLVSNYRPSSLRNLAHTIPKCFESNISGIEYKKYYYDFQISHPHNHLNVIFRYSFGSTFLKNCYLTFTSYQSNRRSASFSESLNSMPLWGIWSPHPSTLEVMSTVNHTNLRFKILAECGVSFYEQQPCHKNKIRRIAHSSILRFQFCILNCFFPSSSVLFSERLSNALQ